MLDEYEYDYNRIVEDTDDLLIEDEDYTQSDWEDYYHNLTEDID